MTQYHLTLLFSLAPLLTLAGDKSGFTLWNPTPPGQLRELSADRPDKTESAFTVDAGHFQLEMDFANYSRDKNHHDLDESWEATPVLFKLGVLNDLDIQIGLTPGRWERTSGSVDRRSGFGDIIPRLKLNLLGNDGGPIAIAVLPFVKVPTSTGHLGNNAVEGGLKVPIALDVEGWDLAMQTEMDWSRNDGLGGYHQEYVNSISIGHQLIGKWSIAVEFYTQVSTERSAGWIGTFDTWLTYQVSDNLRLDAGVYIGVTRAADDLHPFLGMSWRY